MKSPRRKARTIALQALYEFDCADHDPLEACRRLAKEESLDDDAVSFAQELIEGVLSNRQELDASIRKFAPTFPIEHLASVDRTILRLAVLEIAIQRKVPIKVAINEAVELAKTFGSENSPKFINGVLGSISMMVLQG